MSSATLHFPSKEAIVSYLEQYPSTSKAINPYLSTKNIIEAVAGFFADQEEVAPDGVDTGVMLTMMDLNEKLDLPQIELVRIKLNLTTALKDCAAGKAISMEKTSDKAISIEKTRRGGACVLS